MYTVGNSQQPNSQKGSTVCGKKVLSDADYLQFLTQNRFFLSPVQSLKGISFILRDVLVPILCS